MTQEAHCTFRVLGRVPGAAGPRGSDRYTVHTYKGYVRQTHSVFLLTGIKCAVELWGDTRGFIKGGATL